MALDDWGADRGIARFSALQRAEIAEIWSGSMRVSVAVDRFSALQRAEIAEIVPLPERQQRAALFQCSSTSRNC